MTRAPANIAAVRSLLLTHLNIDKGAVRDADLEPAEVGIVGDPAHRGGYHCGSDRVVTNDYSVVESSRDRNGLTDDAAALDVGQFRVVSGGRTHDLQSFSVWCVGECQRGAPDTKDIREIIYTTDGKTVRRWDRLGRRSSGDSSHLWHTHFSFFRDAIKAGRDQTPLFRRYLTSIGLLEDPNVMDKAQEAKLDALHADVRKMLTMNLTTYPDGRPENALAWTLRSARDSDDPIFRTGAYAKFAKTGAPGLRQVADTLAALAAREVDVDEEALATTLLRILTPEKIAAAIPATVAAQVADELARRLAGSQE